MRIAPYLLSMVLTILCVVMLWQWRSVAVDLRTARDEAERHKAVADRAVQRADSIALSMVVRQGEIAALKHALDSAERAVTPMPTFVDDAERMLDSGGLDSIRAVLLRRPE